ncbi:UNVERIFIED_ORG: hypothetical protein ABIC62_001343 [Burkholderia sp. 1595]|uniref:Uncharacterized protein n=1 Tax=Paraburkholderia terricola TaxID=169427 RepID=A0ABU1LL77_9BURK|nr:hypothetical protein [Paraburkholderia terricola]MDR6480281.1 hypothetical protein [Paraburkholderia terricola]
MSASRSNGSRQRTSRAPCANNTIPCVAMTRLLMAIDPLQSD